MTDDQVAYLQARLFATLARHHLHRERVGRDLTPWQIFCLACEEHQDLRAALDASGVSDDEIEAALSRLFRTARG
jgi:hypothetical protein